MHLKHPAEKCSPIVGLVFGILVSAAALASAQDWHPTSAPTKDWEAVASSADGTRLVAVALGDSIYTSTNSGNTWAATGAPARGWWCVAGSADGTTLLAGTDDNRQGTLFLSTNSGVTWSTNGPPSSATLTVGVSADGTKLLAGTDTGLYTSTNAGATWNAAAVSGAAGCTSVAGSADGTTWIAVGSTVLVSTNSGVTWNDTGLVCWPGNQWPHVVAAADGQRLAALVPQFSASSPGLYVSTNAGATWTGAPEPNQAVYSLACSGDGSRLVAATDGGFLTSTDFGSTWRASSAPCKRCSGVAASTDGSKLVAVTLPGTIFTWQEEPALQLALSGANSVITWPALASAEGSVLQQSADLAQADWTLVPAPVTATNAGYQVTLPLKPKNTFYRLSPP